MIITWDDFKQKVKDEIDAIIASGTPREQIDPVEALTEIIWEIYDESP